MSARAEKGLRAASAVAQSTTGLCVAGTERRTSMPVRLGAFVRSVKPGPHS